MSALRRPGGRAEPRWTSPALILVFFSTAQLICLTIFEEYLGRVYVQGKHRPLYLVDEIVTRDAEPEARG
jgi:polyisoprenyl-phosphate glycosyltransferase